MTKVILLWSNLFYVLSRISLKTIISSHILRKNMKLAIFLTLTLGLFLVPTIAIASQEPTAEQKKQWADDAEKFKRTMAAMSGKMGGADHSTEKSIIIPAPRKNDTFHQQAKL